VLKRTRDAARSLNGWLTRKADLLVSGMVLATGAVIGTAVAQNVLPRMEADLSDIVNTVEHWFDILHLVS
jgi:hypothetical protein